ncbi:MAG: peptidase M1, partial [Bacteroidetes bacterium HGW-Bacteroidetes-15]
MKKITVYAAVLVLFLSTQNNSQTKTFTRQDTLRGTITKEREWWDLTYYHLNVTVTPKDSSISGNNIVRYKVLSGGRIMQIDLQPPLKITKVSQDNTWLEFSREGNAYYIKLTGPQNAGDIKQIDVFYEGNPTVAKNPPWSGGGSWKKDSKG